MKKSLRCLTLVLTAVLSLGVAVSATRLKLPAFSRSAGGAIQDAPAITAEDAEKNDAKPDALVSQPARDVILQTDKADYLPGEVVVITGSGWEPGETVSILLHEEPAIHADRKITVVADALGRIFDNQFVPESHDLGVLFIVSARGHSSGASASTMAAQAKPAVNLDQWANCALNQVCPGSWQNGNLNGSQAHYSEGDSVPYRAVFSSLVAGATYTATIEWDTTQSSKHAIDYLTTWNRTANPDPCAGVAGLPAGACSSPTTFAIPVDANVTNGPNGAPAGGDDITQIPGNFTLYNGSIGGLSGYTLTGTYAGTSKTSIVVTFSAGADGTAVLAWGGHISTRVNWGLGASAVAISGSPFHMRLIGFTCSNVSNCGVGQQDRSLSADAVIFPGSITIIKNAVPDHAQDFAFSATGGLSPASFTLDDDGTLASPSATPASQSYPNILTFTTYTVAETAVSNWNIGISCAITSPNGGSATGSNGTATINLKEGENATCTFTNTLQQGTLTVIKNVVNNNGGQATASNFTLSVKSGGSHVSGSPAAGSASGTAYTLPPGTYVVGEDTPPSGYSQTGFSGDCNSSGSVTIANGDSKTCTITNDDQAAKLIVIKHVVNDSGGTATAANFTLDSGGDNDSPDNFAGAESPGTEVTLDAGSYNVTESGPSGYTASYSANCSGTIALGQTKTCTVTNDDQAAKLIVIKHVVNDNGGTATAANFTLDSGGTNDTPDNFAGAESPGTEVTLDAGSYNVTETGPSGYTASYSADCSGSIGVGVTKTCTVTNDDQAAKLIVIKHVVNDNGGTATAANFTLDSGGTNDTPDNFAGAESPGTEVTLDAGAYNVTESGPSGYTASFSADCSGSLASGQTKTCTVTNDDSPAGTTSTTTMSWTLKDTMNLGALRRGTCGPAGTVVFKLYRYDFGTPNESLSCGGENLVWTSTDPATPGGPPTPPIAEVNGLASVSHDITQEGIYLWVVDYTGDNCNTPATNDCGREVTRISSEDLTAVPQP